MALKGMVPGLYRSGSRRQSVSAPTLKMMEKANSIVFLLTQALPAFGMAKEFESDIRGTQSCQGEVNPKILEKASRKPDPPVWLNDAPDAVGHPNEAEIEALNYQIAELISEGTI